MEVNNVGIDSSINTIKIDSANNEVDVTNAYFNVRNEKYCSSENSEAFFEGYMFNASANWPAVMLHNPTGSGKMIYVDDICVANSSSSVCTAAYLKIMEGIDSGTHVKDGKNKRGWAVGEGDLYTKEHSYAISDAFMAVSANDLTSSAGLTRPFTFTHPMGLGENHSLVVYFRADYNLHVTFNWIERAGA